MVVSAHLEKEGRKMILAVLRGAITCSNKDCLGIEKNRTSKQPSLAPTDDCKTILEIISA